METSAERASDPSTFGTGHDDDETMLAGVPAHITLTIELRDGEVMAIT